MKDNKVIVGIIGCGAFSESQHFPNCKSNPLVEIGALCDLRTERMDYLEKKFDLNNPFKTTNFEELINRSEIDMVIIATDHNTHLDIIEKASQKGKHILVEKPMSIDYMESVKMVRAVQYGSIEFRDVYFRYYKNREKWVLENINLTINPGETVGIIGSTGSGKTSLVQLIPRLYDVDNGEVLVDGINVKDYDLDNLRNDVGIVLQNNLLFTGTILENLKWGDKDADEDTIRKFAESAQAHGFISSFKDEYHTFLGQGGVNVSGGQKQRLTIARALLKQPKILILDDSTSAVDTATEARIRENFRNVLKNTTKLIIAQRISSVIDSDKIVVIDDGKIVGVGSHEHLMKTSKEYQEIYYSQIDKEEVTAL
jgi:ABC-type multidrug transport system fused ATPase/permease subunit